jgi:hypothetical protein
MLTAGGLPDCAPEIRRIGHVRRSRIGNMKVQYDVDFDRFVRMFVDRVATR